MQIAEYLDPSYIFTEGRMLNILKNYRMMYLKKFNADVYGQITESKGQVQSRTENLNFLQKQIREFREINEKIFKKSKKKLSNGERGEAKQEKWFTGSIGFLNARMASQFCQKMMNWVQILKEKFSEGEHFNEFELNPNSFDPHEKYFNFDNVGGLKRSNPSTSCSNCLGTCL